MPTVKKDYTLYDVRQGSKDWKEMRRGRITMSMIGTVVGHSPYWKGTEKQLAEIIKGNLVKSFTPEQQKRVDDGNLYEPKVRKFLSKKIGKKIYETGFAVWNKDDRFGASLDGIIDDETGIEIKCPQEMYPPILEYMEKLSRGEVGKDDIGHIWKSQYDQIIGNGVITGRKYMIFCVYSIKQKIFFTQTVKVDYDYWFDFLYPKAVDFFQKYLV